MCTVGSPTATFTVSVEKKTILPWLRMAAALLLGALVLAVILPNEGCILNGPPVYPKFYASMWHIGRLWFYPDVFFYIAYLVIATAAVIFGVWRRNKFEVAGWILLALATATILSGS